MAGRVRNFLRGVGDRIAWGPKTPEHSFTTGQLLGGIGSRALNVVFPGLGTAANVAGNAYYGAGPLGGLVDRLRGPGDVQQQPLDFGGGVTPNFQPQIGGPNLNLPPTGGFMPSPYGPYAGGYQAPSQMPQGPNINPITGLPDMQAGYAQLPNYGGQAAPQQGQSLGFPTMGPVFASRLSNQGGGARGAYSQGGHTGDAARALFEGMSDSSRFNTSMGPAAALPRLS